LKIPGKLEIARRFKEQIAGTEEMKKIILEDGHYGRESDLHMEKQFTCTILDN
jgi:hypothetical protein